MQETAKAQELEKEMVRYRNIIRDNLYPSRERLIFNEVLKESVRHLPYREQSALVVQHTPWLRELEKVIHELNVSWNIELGLY